MLRTLAIALTLTLCAALSAEEPPARTPVLVELFTSQSCANCPAADALLRRLHRDQPVPGVEAIVISAHVDFRDGKGWRDPFASPEWTERQGWYSMRWPMRVYTPQAIVDGLVEANGSDEPYIEAAMREAAKLPKGTVRVLTAVNETGVGLRAQVRGLPGGGPAAVFAAIVEDGLETAIPGGENEGATLLHDGVLRLLEPLGETADGARTHEATAALELEPEWKRENLRVVVFVQDGATRRVTAAGQVGVE